MSVPKCSKTCRDNNVSCPVEDCRYWIDFEKEHNCSLISVELNGPMSLVQVAERLNLSFVRVSQIESKIKKKLSTNSELLKLLGN